MPRPKPPPSICAICDAEFWGTNKGQKCCSRECGAEWRRGRHTGPEVMLTCQNPGCENTWTTTQPSQAPKACSRECSYLLRSGERNVNWNGGQHVMADGRVILHLGKGELKFRARAVMEEKVGRELTSQDIVHHVNGNPSDDRPENLQLVTRSEHIQLHRDDLSKAKKASQPTTQIAKAA